MMHKEADFPGPLSRRTFLKGASLAGAVAMAGGMLAGCAPNASATSPEAPVDAVDGTPAFLKKPEPIVDFADTKDFDVVVVGAGASGVAAALKACEEGASVALVQKQSIASSQGFRASGIDLEATSPAGKEAMVSLMMKNAGYRPDRALLRAYADNSGEAILWLRDRFAACGIGARSTSYDNFDIEYNGYKAHFVSAIPDPDYIFAIPALCEYAQEQGVSFFGSMPAVQLVEEGGAVVAVVAGKKSAYTRFNAAKGVILATGDYACNKDMIAHFCPDVNGFPPLTEGRDGDGHCMGTWVGGRIEPVGHTKMIHDWWQNSAPFLLVDDKGERMADEHMPWWELNTLMRDIMQANADEPEKAVIWSIMDADFLDQAEQWAKDDPSIQIAAAEADPSITFTGDTIEEVAEQIGVDKATLKATVDRYNELAEAGQDEDFGKDARFLAPIKKPPFQAILRDFNEGLSAVLGGLVVNDENRVLNDEGEPIAGLFAVGNVSGPFFGSVDYSMQIEGLSVGRAVTTGYVAGRAAAKS